MRVAILGPLEVEVEGERVSLGGPKQRLVLAALALSANRVVPVDRLITAVWGDDHGARAKSTLQVYVSTLRSLLGTASRPGRTVLVAEPPGYKLVIPWDDLDAAEFAGRLEAAEAAKSAGDLEGALRHVDAGLGLWRGAALSDLADELWLQPDVVRLEELRRGAVETRLELLLDLGSHDAVAVEAEQRIAGDPYREHLRALQILALYRAGRQVDALRAYESARKQLIEDVGVEPGPELRALERDILVQDPRLEGPVAPIRTSVVRVRPPLLLSPPYGREREIDAITTALRDGARLLTITGQGGSGKTTLAIAAARQVGSASDMAWVALEGATEDNAGEQIRRAATHVESGLLLVIDNLEHVLAAAREAIVDVLTRDDRVAVLATSRIATGIAGERRIAIGALSDDEATDLLLDRLEAAGAAPVDRQAAAAIARDVDGLPLAIELAAARAAAFGIEAVLGPDAGSRLESSGDRPARHRSLTATIEWGLDLLDDAESEVLARIAAFPGGVGGMIIDGLLGGTAGLGSVTPLLDQGLVRRHADRTGTRLVVPPAVREVLEGRRLIGPEHRRAMASVLIAETAGLAAEESLSPGARFSRLDDDATNLVAALDATEQEDPKAAARLVAAVGDYWLDREQHRRLLTAVTRLAEADDHDAMVMGAVFRLGGRAALADDDIASASELFQRAARSYADAGAEDLRIRALADVALTSLLRGDLLHAEALAWGALAIGKQGPSPGSRHRDPHLVLANVAMESGRLRRAREYADEFLSAARRHPSSASVVDGLTVLAEISVLEGDGPTGRNVAAEALVVASRSGDETGASAARTVLATTSIGEGDVERARGLLTEALARGPRQRRFVASMARLAAALVAPLEGAQLLTAADELSAETSIVERRFERVVTGPLRERLADELTESERATAAALGRGHLDVEVVRAMLSR